MSASTASSTAVASIDSRAQNEARAAVLASLESAGSNYDHQFQRRAADIHKNSAAIARQEAELRKNTAMLAKDAKQWQKEAKKADRAIRDVGNVQNWAEMMERDLLVLEETLRLVEGGERQETASGGSLWR